MTIPIKRECSSLDPALISVLVGLPIVFNKAYALPLITTPRQLLDNQIATHMMIDEDTGFASPEWQSRVGTVMVARKDKRLLDVRHFEGTWMYTDNILNTFVYGDGNTASLRRDGKYTKKDFQEWWKGYADECKQIRGEYDIWS